VMSANRDAWIVIALALAYLVAWLWLRGKK
jgi:hypothetical protein